MKTLAVAALIAVGAIAAGCAPTREQMEHADFGAYPDSAERLADAWLADRLVDPDSRKVSFTVGPERFYWGLSPVKYGYLLCGEVNAKNRMGGYAGREPFWVMIRDDQVVSGDVRRVGESFWLAPQPCQNS